MTKALEVRTDAGTPEEVAAIAASAHERGKITLVIVNTVDRARRVHLALGKKRLSAELVHSRFRGAERKAWQFLRRDTPLPAEGRVIVAPRTAA